MTFLSRIEIIFAKRTKFKERKKVRVNVKDNNHIFKKAAVCDIHESRASTHEFMHAHRYRVRLPYPNCHPPRPSRDRVIDAGNGQ